VSAAVRKVATNWRTWLVLSLLSIVTLIVVGIFPRWTILAVVFVGLLYPYAKNLQAKAGGR
jgi:4-hydroxybenzoate polyprenyltransferase